MRDSHLFRIHVIRDSWMRRYIHKTHRELQLENFVENSGFRSPHGTRSCGYEIVKPQYPILKQLFAVFTTRCRADAFGMQRDDTQRVRSACANWQSARASSLPWKPTLKQTNTCAGGKERGEMKGEQFSRNRKRPARAARDEKFSISRTIIVALAAFTADARFQSRRPPARWVHFVHNSASGAEGGKIHRGHGGQHRRKGSVER